MRYENDSCFSFCEKVEGVSSDAEGDVHSPGIPWHVLNFSALAIPVAFLLAPCAPATGRPGRRVGVGQVEEC